MSGGNGHLGILTFTTPPRRLVSLVPSVTASLIDLGAGERLVGITDFCPAPTTAGVARVGGTRSPDLEAVVALKPELVIANQEENSRESVEALEKRGVKVWVTFPRTVAEALAVLWALIRVLGAPEQGARIRTLEATLEWTQRAAQSVPPVRVFCPIWQGKTADGQAWWMTFNQQTYAADVLTSCGAVNVFADRQRRYPLEADLGQGSAEEPGGRDTRYPHVTAAEIVRAQPALMLLPDEPMAFTADDEAALRTALAETPAVQANRVVQVDGRLLTWHGTTLARALDVLPGLLAG